MIMQVNKYAVIVAGGSGTRMESALPKQFLNLNGKSVLQHSVDVFLEAYEDLHVILVLPPQFMDQFKTTERVTTIEGGDTRFHSVKNGLSRINDDNAIVSVHDSVRCLVTTNLIRRCYTEAFEKGNAIPAIKATDSLRIETADGNRIIDRSKVWIIQTPQTFRSSIITGAFQQNYDTSFTDEASVVERTGVRINLVEGEADNIKITRPVDLLIAEKILNDRDINRRAI